ncbi:MULTISPECIES: electron transport complex subunit RsxC [unclassified Oceanobacter]|uniref:electron transport complex subunit RsxC n=1 Tax=unclassified Oceanobacter TaxID=2620260 RepID=UPI0026E1A299|nr:MULTISPECIES: electron transport complex subunit RsxC [unclassified Oceanobacter]MDO6683701.1 electron transport complex subunit RsxC [Oceanobacter sp. 5_MG-2023]MDP2549402.1 electron transport complex subunit RsxC [Oceanobacter sp. 4_MG-2023]MDP2608318.1 electron transport complex subunit RsxC [Oceanobacter sp. 1_MG-2023]MDP2612203.1 electron transport complex subunit RsxC [Oceanobacter sp. 2_MG-2023]
MLFGLGKIRGGVHPDGHKIDSARLVINSQLPLPDTLWLPLCQHSGEDARPLVQAGERVLKGQRIAAAAGRFSANIHAPTSGTITSIDTITMPHPSGLPANAIILQPDGKDEWITLQPPADPFSMPQEALATLVEQAGIVGMGGAIFPAAIKLRQGRRFEIKTLIVNGSECEPYLTTDDRLMRERAAEIVEGARLVRYIIEAYRTVIAIEDNKPQAIAALQEAAANVGAIEIVVVPARYPMGSAKQLIQAVTGLEVPAGKRSNDIGVLVHNVATVYAIQQALIHGKPLISRVTTVAGGCVGEPRNVEALLGTPIHYLFEQCGGLTTTPARLLMGGPMMGQVLPTTEVPLIKGSSGVLALTKAEVNEHMPSPCIRCGRCVDACPMGLLPLEMARNSKQDDFDSAQDAGLRDCILCGSCSYVCPSHIPLVQYFEYAKGELAESRASQQKLSYTQELMAARKERLEREAAAKEAAKQAKKAKAKAKKPRKAAAPTTVAADTADTAETASTTDHAGA